MENQEPVLLLHYNQLFLKKYVEESSDYAENIHLYDLQWMSTILDTYNKD